MSIISMLNNIGEQRKINRNIEETLTEEGREALAVINKYAPHAWSKNMVKGGINRMPPGSPRPNVFYGMNGTEVSLSREPKYNKEFALMKDFLNEYPQYKTRNAKKIRRWYDL